jgi:hypothetical protein
MSSLKTKSILLTLSSCWYNVRSKFPSKKYLEWIDNFLSIVNNFNLVIYTDKSSYKYLDPLLDKHRNILNIKIKIIIKPMEEFYGYKYKESWIKNHETSNLSLHKFVDWNLIMLWCEKIHLVNETITNKYFDTIFYGWCDIGYFRNKKDNIQTHSLMNWPNPEKLLDKKFRYNPIHYGRVQNNEHIYNNLLQNIQSHYNNNLKDQPTNKINEVCFAGGFFIIRPNIIQTFIDLFDFKLNYYFDNNFIIKDDQTILLDCIITNPELFYIHREEILGLDNWFMFQRILF